MEDYIQQWLIDQMDHGFSGQSFPNNFDFDQCVDALNDSFDEQIVKDQLTYLLTRHLKSLTPIDP